MQNQTVESMNIRIRKYSNDKFVMGVSANSETKISQYNHVMYQSRNLLCGFDNLILSWSTFRGQTDITCSQSQLYMNSKWLTDGRGLHHSKCSVHFILKFGDIRHYFWKHQPPPSPFTLAVRRNVVHVNGQWN